jgi:hypothetical protein
MPAKPDPAIVKLAMIQSKPFIPETSMLFEPLLVGAKQSIGRVLRDTPCHPPRQAKSSAHC